MVTLNSCSSSYHLQSAGMHSLCSVGSREWVKIWVNVYLAWAGHVKNQGRGPMKIWWSLFPRSGCVGEGGLWQPRLMVMGSWLSFRGSRTCILMDEWGTCHSGGWCWLESSSSGVQVPKRRCGVREGKKTDRIWGWIRMVAHLLKEEYIFYTL